jgi:hypothetical protein
VGTYDIEFIRHIDGKAEAIALDVVRLVGDTASAKATAWSFTNSWRNPMPKGARRLTACAGSGDNRPAYPWELAILPDSR